MSKNTKQRKYNKLRGRIIEKYESLRNFSDAINMHRSSVSLIFSGKRLLKAEDIKIFCSALDIKSEEIADYFF